MFLRHTNGSNISIHALARRATSQESQRIRQHDISIHALARRATSGRTWTLAFCAISIHALARRATHTGVFITIGFGTFQSTLSQGERPCKPPQYYDSLLISIHALARRATCSGKTGASLTANFNPRSRKESDLTGAFTMTGLETFQSTLSQGERRTAKAQADIDKAFQSTLSQGERRGNT